MTADLSPATRMTEKQLQQAVVDCARMLGWLCYHTFDSRRSTPGYPDIVCLRDGRCIVAELKTTKGTLSTAQYAWLERFSAIPGVEVHVFRPAQWLDGTVAAILRGETA